MDIFIAQFELFDIVLIASLLGGVIGLERETSHISAGLRTHMLIAASAATLVSLGTILSESYLAVLPLDSLKVDPIGIFQAIIVGISFIGGGIIFRDKDGEHVKNLTTAASILLTSGVGIAVALHQFYFAVGITILVVFVNHILYKVEKKYIN
ncbi:MAG: MgtC/SapB family protein [Candidatus Taylorbacteria bacterium]